MAQPTAYVPATDFSDFEASNPSTPKSGSGLDAEFDALQTTTDEILTNLALIQADDGTLANQVVTPDKLDADTLVLISAGLSYQGAWVTATAYAVGDVVTNSSTNYVCVVAHTSGTFATDLTAVKWVTTAGGLADITGEVLGDLGDVTITSIASGELLKWNGTAWVNNTLAEAGVSAVGHAHATSDITSGTFADARISESNVTQHEAALTITESQISDLGTYQTQDAGLTDISGNTNGAGIFGAIKQAATDSATGVAELATSAETITGADTARVVTPAGAAAAYFPLASMTGGNVIVPHEGLKIVYASASTLTVTAGAVLLKDSSGNAYRYATLSETLDITASGANGLDTGSEASGTWYYIHAIAKSSDGTLDTLFSLSATSPTLPSGYDRSGLLGVWRNDGSGNLYTGMQRGNRYHGEYVSVISGSAGTLTLVDVSAVVPPIATEALMEGYATNDTAGNDAEGSISADSADTDFSSAYFYSLDGATATWTRSSVLMKTAGSLWYIATTYGSGTATLTIQSNGWIL